MSYIYDLLLGHLREELDAGPGITIDNGVISATGVEAVGGDGISTAGGTISLAPATVSDVISGTGSAAVVPSNLASSLSVGKAVDVTSEPDGFTGSDWRSTFTWTGSTLGFAAFPKFASGLSYLLIADLTAEAAATVTPSGVWLSGGTAAFSLPAGSPVRVAMAFDSASDCLLTFSSGATVSVANLREFEVTALTTDAVAYVASLEDPDDTGSYYLIGQDSVDPWTPYIDMGTSPAVTIQAGLAYKLNAQVGSHQITIDTFPANSYGRDAHLELFVGATGLVQFVPPLNLIDALTANAVHNITVKFRDGQANAYVDDTDVGYVVTLTAGTAAGSLYAALAADSDFVVFANSLDGLTVDLAGAVTAGKKTVIGNGYTETVLSGGVSCTSKTIFANLSMDGVSVLGGTTTLGDVYLPQGATVSVSGGGLAIEKVTGAGSLDLGETSFLVPAGGTAYVSGCTVANGFDASSGSINVSGTMQMVYVLITGCTGNTGGAFVVTGRLEMSRCTVSGNDTTNYGGAMRVKGGATVTLTSCTFSDNYKGAANSGTIRLEGGCVFRDKINLYGTANVVLAGSNTVNAIASATSVVSAASVTISAGAVVDLTGTTYSSPIAPGGAIIIANGDSTASCTVLTGATAGVVGATVSIVGGTYTSISSDGTTVPPQPEPAEE